MPLKKFLPFLNSLRKAQLLTFASQEYVHGSAALDYYDTQVCLELTLANPKVPKHQN